VPANLVAPNLVFDHPGDVSPSVEDKFIFGGPNPILKHIAHQGDTLIYQGSSFNGNGIVGPFSTPTLLRMPLDIPDLPVSARDFYLPEELQGLGAADIPFTLRVTAIPEPAAVPLAVACSLCFILLLRRNPHCRWRSP
jgi:hypothetical protein